MTLYINLHRFYQQVLATFKIKQKHVIYDKTPQFIKIKILLTDPLTAKKNISSINCFYYWIPRFEEEKGEAEAYLEACQTSKMKRFAKIVKG